MLDEPVHIVDGAPTAFVVRHTISPLDSAHFEYGPDTVTVFDDVFKDGVRFSEDQTVDHNRLGKHLDTIKSAIEKVGEALNKS